MNRYLLISLIVAAIGFTGIEVIENGLAGAFLSMLVCGGGYAFGYFVKVYFIDL